MEVPSESLASGRLRQKRSPCVKDGNHRGNRACVTQCTERGPHGVPELFGRDTMGLHECFVLRSPLFPSVVGCCNGMATAPWYEHELNRAPITSAAKEKGGARPLAIRHVSITHESLKRFLVYLRLRLLG